MEEIREAEELLSLIENERLVKVKSELRALPPGEGLGAELKAVRAQTELQNYSTTAATTSLVTGSTADLPQLEANKISVEDLKLRVERNENH